MTSVTHIFKISELKDHATAFQVVNGTATIFVKEDKVHVTVNADPRKVSSANPG